MKIKGESTVLFPPKRISNFSTLCVTASPERFDDRSGDFFLVFLVWGFIACCGMHTTKVDCQFRRPSRHFQNQVIRPRRKLQALHGRFKSVSLADCHASNLKYIEPDQTHPEINMLRKSNFLK